MDKYKKLVLCGSVSIDRIMSFQGLFSDHLHPEKLEALSISLLMDKLIISDGGIAGNIAYNLALLKQPSILVAAVGQDAKGYMAKLKKMGTHIENVVWSTLPTSSFAVMTDAKENQIGGFYPGAMAESLKISLEKWMGKKSLVVISAHDPTAMKKQVQECQKYGIDYLYDVSQQVSNIPTQDILEGIQGSQITIVNDYEHGVISKRTGLSPSDVTSLCPIFITTKGEGGSVIEGSSTDKPILIPSATPNKIEDPTGAGDAFRAGFLYGYAKSYTVQKSAMLGSVLASFAIEKQGTQNHVCSMTDVKKRFESAYHQKF